MTIVHLEILPWLSRYFSADPSTRAVLQTEVRDGSTIRDLLQEIASRNPAFGKTLFDENDQVAVHISLILNGRLYELAGGLEAELRHGDTVRLLPAFSGG